MSNLSAINDYINSSITTYTTEAGKAKLLNSRSNSVLESLERFFHKLEFLLKYGHLPTNDDASGKSLPKELQGLKDFLSESNNNYYILQRNPTERYSFSWQGESLNVTRQRYYPSLAEFRCGFVGAEEYRWRAETTESVTSDAILSILGFPDIPSSSASALENNEIADRTNTEKQENISPSVESPRVQPETEQQTLRGDQNITESAELERKKSGQLSSLTNFVEDVERNVNSLDAEVRAFNENKSEMLTIFLNKIKLKHDVISNLIEITNFYDFMKWLLTNYSNIKLILEEKQCYTKYLYKKFSSQLEYMAYEVGRRSLNIKSEKGTYTVCWDKEQSKVRIAIDDQAVNDIWTWNLISLSRYIVNNGKSKDDVTNDVHEEKEQLEALISTLNAHGVESVQTYYRNEFFNIQEDHKDNGEKFNKLKQKFNLSQKDIDSIGSKMAKIESALENLNKQIDLISPQFTEVAVGAGGDREGAGAPAAAAPAEDRRP
ncbi:hypothetical protein F9222_26095 [Escherichia coli]|nr:hypothetical protein F9222_26095 [Escherichia coli]